MPVENIEQVIETVVDRKAERGQPVECPRCGSNYMRRVKRSGFLEGRVCSIFGYYPWKCTKCLGNFLIKRRGLPQRHQAIVANAQ